MVSIYQCLHYFAFNVATSVSTPQYYNNKLTHCEGNLHHDIATEWKQSTCFIPQYGTIKNNNNFTFIWYPSKTHIPIVTNTEFIACNSLYLIIPKLLQQTWGSITCRPKPVMPITTWGKHRLALSLKDQVSVHLKPWEQFCFPFYSALINWLLNCNGKTCTWKFFIRWYPLLWHLSFWLKRLQFIFCCL